MADTWYEKKSAPSPKGEFTPVNVGQQYTTGGTMADYQGWGTSYGGGNNVNSFQQPKPDYLQQAIDIYDSMGSKQPQQSYGDSQVHVTNYPSTFETSRSASENMGQRGSSTYTRGGGQPAFQREIKPLQAIEAPEAEKFKARDYKPPEEDPRVYSKARDEAMGPGLRALREGTREAISTSQSLDNPNARGLFIKQALQGMGSGLEGVSAAAGREARSVAGQKRSEQLNIYNTKYQARTDADKINYQAKVNQMAQNFAQQQAVAQANYQMQFNTDPRLKMPGDNTTGGGSNFIKGFGYKKATGNFYM